MRRSLLLKCLLIGISACHDRESINYKVFKYCEFNNITSLDPAFARSNNNMWAVNQIYDGLLRLDDSLNVVPSIAKSWNISDDGLEYTFNLRQDVYFHNDDCFEDTTRIVTAHDVAYSFNRLIDDAIASPGSWVFKGKVFEETPFQAKDDSTFKLRLKSPFIPMLGLLSMQYCNIIPHEAVEKYGGDFRSNPVGSGPFIFKRWVENQSLFLNKNENYYESSKPKLDGVKINFVGDRKIAFLELLNGNLDYFSGLESSFVNELLTKEGHLQENKKDQIKFEKAPYLNFEYLGILMEGGNDFLKDKKVRQALNYAIDRKTMLTLLRNNIGVPANSGVIPRGLPSFAPEKVKGYTYDVEKAKMLLSEAGFNRGHEFPIIILNTNNDYLDLCTFIVNQWRKIGVNAKIEVMESAMLRDGMRNGKVEFFRASWIADYPDGENFLCLFYSKNPAPPNYTQFSNPQFDIWYEEAVKTSEAQDRFALYHKMDSLLVEEAPVIFLFYDEKAQFTSKRTHQMSKNAVNMLDLREVYF